MTISVYEQYFAAEGEMNGIARNGVLVRLCSDSADGEIVYEIQAAFFPHTSEEDYGITYDAYFSREIYRAKGRRSRKREAGFMDILHEEADRMTAESGLKILWDKPLREARIG